MNEKSKPDYAYNPDDWESTYSWDQRADLEDELEIRLGDVRQVATLIEGPAKFLAVKVTTWDEAGDPDDYEVGWFDTKAEADAAVAAQLKARP